MAKALQPLIIAAFGIVLGTLLIILSATVVENHNGWPIVSLLLYFLTPIPFVLSRRSVEWGSYPGDLSLVQLLFRFLGGTCAVSGPCVAIALYHVGIIGQSALILTLISGVFFLISARSVLLCLQEEEEEEEDQETEDDDLFA